MPTPHSSSDPDSTSNTDSPQRLERKSRIASGLNTLVNDISDLRFNLTHTDIDRLDGDMRDEYADMLRTYIDIIDAEFAYLQRLLDGTPSDLFTFSFTGQPSNTVSETVQRAREQFTEVVEPLPTAVTNGEFEESEWGRFYGKGFGHSYAYALDYVAENCTDEIDNQIDDPHTTTAAESETETETEDETESETETETEDETESETETEDETTTPSADNSETTATSDRFQKNWSEYEGELIYTEEREPEPLATDTRLPQNLTILAVDESHVLEPPCKYGGCPSDGRYILTFEWQHETRYARLCGNHLPTDAKALASGYRIFKTGRMQTEGDAFSTLNVAQGSSNEWYEKHAISGGAGKAHDGLAHIKYQRQCDTLYISVQESVTQHGREGQYSVDIDEWRGGIPYIDALPIGEWLTQRAKKHRETIFENDGVERHLVSIDRDMCIIQRAQKAYRERNPDFSQPSGLINDRTPVVDACITVCADCGEIVAGIMPDDAETCEYCGSDEATWYDEYHSDGDTTDGEETVPN